MKKTIQLFLFLMIITGMIFTACESAIDEAVDDGDQEEIAVVAVVDEPAEDLSTYTDGTYTQTGDYVSPNGTESITVSLTLEGDVVTSVDVVSNATAEVSIAMQGLFIDGVDSVVVGKSLDEIGELAQVNGSSLTSGGFNAAVEAIKDFAKA